MLRKLLDDGKRRGTGDSACPRDFGPRVGASRRRFWNGGGGEQGVKAKQARWDRWDSAIFVVSSKIAGKCRRNCGVLGWARKRRVPGGPVKDAGHYGRRPSPWDLGLVRLLLAAHNGSGRILPV